MKAKWFQEFDESTGKNYYFNTTTNTYTLNEPSVPYVPFVQKLYRKAWSNKQAESDLEAKAVKEAVAKKKNAQILFNRQSTNNDVTFRVEKDVILEDF